MHDPRPGEGTDAAHAPSASNSGSAPTIDPAVPVGEPITATDLPGQLGRFAIRGFLGAGAFGTVYRAYDPQLEREVALKVTRAAGQSPERVQRFRREARAAAGLRHPNIVPLFEAGEADGHLYLAVAYVSGQTLEEVLAKQDGKPLPPAQAAAVVRRLADALAYAHGQGVLHRDVKSANVLLDGAGEPHLLDFGLARRAEDQDRMTVAGAVLGTAAYLAPEAAKGDQTRWTQATDQYALGVVLYELLTGHTPFTGPIELVLALHQTQEPGRPSRQNREVPRDLDAICLKCLEKDPGRRYASAADLAADLDRFLRGEPVLARRQTMRYLAGKFARRYWQPLTLTAAVVLVAVAGAAAAFVRINAERAEAVKAGEREQGEREKAEQALVDLEHSRKEGEVVWKVVDEEYANVRDDQIRHIKGLGATHEELAAIRLKAYQRLAELTPDDATLAPRLARGHYVLGSISSVVGRLERGETNLRKAAELYEALEKREPQDRLYRTLRCRALSELGYLFYEAGLNSHASPILEQALALADDGLKADPDSPDLLYEGARAAARLAQVLHWKTERPRRAALHARAREAHDRLLKRSHRPADNHLGRALATYNAYYNTPVRGGDGAFSRMLDEHRTDLDAALKLLPDSPVLNFISAWSLIDLGESAERTETFAQARPHFDRAVTTARELAKGTPEAGRFVSLLPVALTASAKNLQRQRKLPEARAAHEESLKLQAALTERFNDRPAFGKALIEQRNDYAEFLSTSNITPDPVAKAQEVLRARDQAVADGRQLSARFPANAGVNVLVVAAMAKRAAIDKDAGRFEAALPFATELVSVCRDRILAHEPASTEADKLLMHFQDVESVFSKTGRSEPLLDMGRLALRLVPYAGHDGLQSACGVLNACGKTRLDAKQIDEAVTAYKQVVEAATPHLRKHPWHWYLRSNLQGAHRALAEVYRDRGDTPREVQHLRELLRVWYDPYSPVRAKPFLQSGRPEDAGEAKAIRAEIEARAGGMKRFTIPCDFNGIKYPFHVYVMDLKWPQHPLGDQARWLKEVRGGTIPKEVMESFRRLHVIAHENNVSLQDLCVYALGTAAAEDGQELKVEDVGVTGKGTKTENPKLASLKARAVELKGKLDGAAGSRADYAKLAQTYVEVAEACLAQQQRAEAVAAFESGIRQVERALDAAPRSLSEVELLARALRGLGRTLAQLGRLDEAVVVQLRFVEAADRLHQWPAEAGGKSEIIIIDWQAERTDGWITLGDVFLLRKQPAEAARWYLKGVAVASDEAARKFGRLVQLHPPALGVAPADVRAAFGRAAEWKGELKAVPERFVSELKDARAAQRRRQQEALNKEQSARAAALELKVKKYRKLVDEYLELEQPGDAIEWLLEEAALRAEQARLAPADLSYWRAEAAVAYQLAGLCDKQERPADAVKWMNRASTLGHEQAAFAWAAWHAEGKHVKKDAGVASQLKGLAHFRRGDRLLTQGSYKEAVPDLKAAAEAYPKGDLIFKKLGQAYAGLGRWDEAARAYRDSYEIYKLHNGAALSAAEAMVIAGQAKEVAAFVAGLDKKVWDPPPPYTAQARWPLAMMQGYRAIAERLGSDGDGETPAEKRLFELTAVPGFKAGDWSWGAIEGWLSKADLPDKKKLAVRRILEEMKGNAQERFTPLVPLAVGAKWTYSQKWSDEPELELPDVTVEVLAREKVNGVECYKLQRKAGESKTEESLIVRYDGVYRMAQYGKPLATPYRLLALPPGKGKAWKSGENKLGLLLASSVETPAGKHEGAWMVLEEKDNQAETLVQRTWYAVGVGPVKIETPRGAKSETTVVLTLKAYSPPR